MRFKISRLFPWLNLWFSNVYKSSNTQIELLKLAVDQIGRPFKVTIELKKVSTICIYTRNSIGRILNIIGKNAALSSLKYLLKNFKETLSNYLNLLAKRRKFLIYNKMRIMNTKFSQYILWCCNKILSYRKARA